MPREETRRTEADHFDPTRAPRARQMTVVNDFARLDQAPVQLRVVSRHLPLRAMIPYLICPRISPAGAVAL